MSRLVMAVACALLAGAAQADEKLELRANGAKATVVEREARGARLPALEISVSSGGKTATFRHAGLTLDPESQGTAEIVKASQGSFLFVHAYSGGASCCWSVVVVDVGARKDLGALLPSRSPVELVKGSGGCELAAEAEPIDGTTGARPGPGRQLYCFDGKAFAKAPAR